METVSKEKPRETLLKYDDPIESPIIPEKMKAEIKAFPTATRKKTQLPPLEAKPTTDDMLNAILPPREWTENNVHYTQYVSHKPGSRKKMEKMQKKLDEQLTERQAKDNGICPIREELFSQVFDEIIRQVTLNCMERGLLLQRVKDQLKMTIAAYQTLYQSSVVFGLRKHLQAQQGIPELQQRVEDLRRKKLQLYNKEIELKLKINAIQKRNNTQFAIFEKIRNVELESLNHQEKEIRDFLESTIEPPSPTSPPRKSPK